MLHVAGARAYSWLNWVQQILLTSNFAAVVANELLAMYTVYLDEHVTVP